MASKRKGRPLLAAAAGVAFVSFASCQQYDKPVGNLRAPEPEPPTAGTSSEPTPAPSATIATSGGTGGTSAAPPEPPTTPPIMPVGNLRPPETAPEPKPVPSTTSTPKNPPKPHPVGNLRPPSDH